MNEPGTNPTAALLEHAKTSALESRIYYSALRAQGFRRSEAMRILVAWMGRTVPVAQTDMAALNAVMQNFAEKLT